MRTEARSMVMRVEDVGDLLARLVNNSWEAGSGTGVFVGPFEILRTITDFKISDDVLWELFTNVCKKSIQKLVAIMVAAKAKIAGVTRKVIHKAIKDPDSINIAAIIRAIKKNAACLFQQRLQYFLATTA